ncbi:hypothetical protein PHYSODRAFT_254233, partial [Phytophthora sojae]
TAAANCRVLKETAAEGCSSAEGDSEATGVAVATENSGTTDAEKLFTQFIVMSPIPHDDADAVQTPGVAPVPVPGQVAEQVGDDAAGDQFDASTRESGRGASDSSGDRLDRLEGLIEGLVRDAARDRLEKAQLQHGVYVSNSSAAGSSAFSQFLAARRQRVRADSLSEAMGISPAMQQQHFLDELIAAQVISGGDCPEDFKARALNRYLEGPARKYFDRMKTIWSAESPTLEHLMNRMLEVYEKEITVEQATRMM